MLKIFKKLLVLKHTAEAEGTEWFDSLEMTIMVLRELELERTVWGIGKREVTRLPTSASNFFIFEEELVAEHL